MQKSHVKCTVAPNEAYRPSIFVLNFGKAVSVEFLKILKKKLLRAGSSLLKNNIYNTRLLS